MLKKFSVRKNVRRKFKRRFRKAKKIPMYRIPNSIKPEVKRIINNVWTAETLDNPAAYSINNEIIYLAQGADYNNRIGDRVYVKGIYVKGYIEGSSGANFQNYRIDFVKDYEPAAGVPSWATVYLAGTTDTDSLQSFVNPLYRRRFRIARSIRGTLRTQATEGTVAIATPGVRKFRYWIPIRKMVVFNTSSAATPNQGMGFYAIGWSDLTSNTPKVYMQTELVFTDA